MLPESFKSANHFLSRDHHTFSFASTHQPVLSVEPGELIHLQTWDCFAGQIVVDADLIKDIDDSKVNPATGPIYIKSAEPGDTLAITILEIITQKRGVARCFEGEGQLSHLLNGPYGRFFEVVDGVVTMNEQVSFPAVPMLGVIGVAPESGEIATMPAGKHGGNLDNNMNKVGATIYLPVKHSGALLGIGDMHAAMGDGEISGTGVEIGGDVLIKVDVIKAITTDYPVTELDGCWITHGVAVQDIEAAMRIACEQAAGLLVDHWGFTIDDAFIFLSVACDLGIAQNVHPSTGTVIAKLRVPKLAACPRPFKL
jgi:amidase